MSQNLQLWVDSPRDALTTRKGGRRGESDWLTLGQAAHYLGVAQSTIRKWSDIGRVRAFKTPGGHRRYRRADLDEFLDGLRHRRVALAARSC